MFCDACGARNRDAAKFCRACGGALTDSTPDISESPTLAPALSPAAAGTPEVRLAGRYSVSGVIGRGGMGIVHQGRDAVLDRLVAIKILKESYAEDPEFIDRFLKEARIAARLRHPNIVSIHEVGRSERGWCYIMDYIDGETLSGLVRRRGAIPADDAARVIVEIAKAVSFAHESGVLHRDLKPENVMIDRQGNVVVMDFGLARAADDPRLTRTGHVVGSPLYMSPEQGRGENVDQRSDIFSIGLIYFFLLTGRHFFHGETISSVVEKQKRLPIPQTIDAAGLPSGAGGILKGMLQRDPHIRTGTLREVLSALREGPPPPPREAHPSQPAPRTEELPDPARRARERLKRLLDRMDPEGTT